MPTKTPGVSTKTLTGTLRGLLRDSGMSINAIANDLGVAQPVLWRFATGKSGLTLRTAQKMIDYFGYELVPRGRGKGGERMTGRTTTNQDEHP